MFPKMCPIWRSGDDRHVFRLEYGAARFFYAAALAGRNICSLGFLERPITLGFLWGACTGDWASVMLCAVFFELLWLDVFAVGTYVPPMPAYSFVVFLFLAQTFSCTSGGDFLIALAISSVPAYIQTAIDVRHRARLARAHSGLMAAAEAPRPLGRVPSRLILSSSLWQMIVGLTVFFPVLLASAGLYTAARRALDSDSFVLVPGTYVAAAAALGAIAALRLRKAYAVFLLCVVLFLL